MNDVIHPGTTLDVTNITVDSVSESAKSLPDLVVEYEVAAEGLMACRARETVSGAVLLRIAREAIERSFPST
jgi:hypothetical protein